MKTATHATPTHRSRLPLAGALLALLAATFFTGCATTPSLTSGQYREQAYQEALRGEASLSIRDAKKAIALNPKDQWTKVSYGWCLYTLGRYGPALTAWENAYKLDPEGYRINACLAIANYRLGHLSAAVASYNQQVMFDPAFGKWKSLQDATSYWKPKEKSALYAVFNEWRKLH
ncbi:hypothetical protein BH09VER1_BH09VER1_46200 [soil metagenome]